MSLAYVMFITLYKQITFKKKKKSKQDAKDSGYY